LRLAAALLHLLGQEGRLAIRQLERQRTRTGLTVGVLMVAIVFVIGFGQSFRNSLRHIHDWWERVIAIDFYVRAAWPDLTTHITTAALPETLAEEIAALDGVEHVGKFNFIAARANDRPVVVLAFTVPPNRPPSLALVDGEPRAVQRGLLQGE